MSVSRRGFVRAASASVLSISAAKVHGAAVPSSKVNVGIIGAGGMGMQHIRNLAPRDDVSITSVCDVDTHRRNSAADYVKQATGVEPKKTGDLREVFADDQIDAVFIATPDHWHGPAAVMALDAGKHVYVEKPCCHNLAEGRAMAEAVQRSGKILQVGTQSRSTDCVKEAIDRVHRGELGDVLVAKAWNSQRRGSIGRSEPSMAPDHLDYEMWLGPAPKFDYRSNLLHGVWRWWYPFGCGDIGNDGVHDIDVAVWGLEVTRPPERVTCMAGKYFFDDDQQFPDTQYAVCEYPADAKGRRKQLIFEQRIWTPYTQEGYENGGAFYGTEGYLIIGHTVGWKQFKPNGDVVAERTGRADLQAHHTDFIECVQGKRPRTAADIQAGVDSASIVHLANIAARTQTVVEYHHERGEVTNNTAANALVKRKYHPGHWAIPSGLELSGE